eukprot:CAMPEP_0197674002 /NCGR_PEP_ID=MMETSP1338-20131121/82070_1 /TAXON_ID=43686 ORGANISM="Pelagodinium beii, Strain RCC1491" /NCGR_SAMPLE_ID=MMETSP1338 /ASSEMBLY_ACC=CAM_ASM_000754 /LENGTH=98 /DNA_ID=CAMNT_0043254325 /DNA_START=73 /DNA_END=370 /DNA_ORIENTATION=+
MPRKKPRNQAGQRGRSARGAVALVLELSLAAPGAARAVYQASSSMAWCHSQFGHAEGLEVPPHQVAGVSHHFIVEEESSQMLVSLTASIRGVAEGLFC